MINMGSKKVVWIAINVLDKTVHKERFFKFLAEAIGASEQSLRNFKGRQTDPEKFRYKDWIIEKVK